MNTDDRTYMVRLRETGSRRHELLGEGRLTAKRLHAVTFDNRQKAEDACRWMLDNNDDALDSGQVIDADTGRVLDRFEVRQTLATRI